MIRCYVRDGAEEPWSEEQRRWLDTVLWDGCVRAIVAKQDGLLDTYPITDVKVISDLPVDP